MQVPSVPIKWESASRAILFICAGFAIGAIGFFLAVFLGYKTQSGAQATSQVNVIQAQKSAATQRLSASEASSGAIVVASSSLLSVPEGQAATNDQNASTKLKILESLNQK